MTMPDSNSAAESKRNADEAAGESLREQYSEKALEDLVWRMMDGQSYPRATCRMQINLLDIICEADALDIAAELCAALRPEFTGDVREKIETIVHDYLRDSHWHEMRVAEMIEEARDDEV